MFTVKTKQSNVLKKSGLPTKHLHFCVSPYSFFCRIAFSWALLIFPCNKHSNINNTFGWRTKYKIEKHLYKTWKWHGVKTIDNIIRGKSKGIISDYSEFANFLHFSLPARQLTKVWTGLSWLKLVKFLEKDLTTPLPPPKKNL